MSIFKTPEENLFKAVEQVNVRKVRELLASGTDPNAVNKFGLKPLDACIETLKNYVGRTGLYDEEITVIFNTKLIWDELVRKGGSLNKYKDDPQFEQGFTVKQKRFGKPGPDMVFPAPKPKH